MCCHCRAKLFFCWAIKLFNCAVNLGILTWESVGIRSLCSLLSDTPVFAVFFFFSAQEVGAFVYILLHLNQGIYISTSM